MNDEAISTAIAGFLGRVGIKTEVSSRPIAQHSVSIVNADSDFYLYGWGVPTYDSAYIFDFLVATRGKEGRGAQNATALQQPAIWTPKIISLSSGKRCGQAQRHHQGHLASWSQKERFYIPLHDQVIHFASVNPSTFLCTPTTRSLQGREDQQEREVKPMLVHLLRRLGQSVLVLLAVSLISFHRVPPHRRSHHQLVGRRRHAGRAHSPGRRAGLQQIRPHAIPVLCGQGGAGGSGHIVPLEAPVADMIAERLPATLELALTAAVLALVIGVVLGVYTAITRMGC